jgi:hypothetical protein
MISQVQMEKEIQEKPRNTKCITHIGLRDSMQERHGGALSTVRRQKAGGRRNPRLSFYVVSSGKAAQGSVDSLIGQSFFFFLFICAYKAWVILLTYFAVLEVKPRPSHTLGKHFTTGASCGPAFVFKNFPLSQSLCVLFVGFFFFFLVWYWGRNSGLTP